MGRRHKRVRAILGMLLVMLLAGAYAAPTTSAAGLRAAKCCAERCEKPRSPTAARHCCPSLGSTDDVGAFAVSAKTPVDGGSAPAAIFSGLQSVAAAVSLSPKLGGPSPRAAPLFLRTLSLRL